MSIEANQSPSWVASAQNTGKACAPACDVGNRPAQVTTVAQAVTLIVSPLAATCAKILHPLSSASTRFAVGVGHGAVVVGGAGLVTWTLRERQALKPPGSTTQASAV